MIHRVLYSPHDFEEFGEIIGTLESTCINGESVSSSGVCILDDYLFFNEVDWEDAGQGCHIEELI